MRRFPKTGIGPVSPSFPGRTIPLGLGAWENHSIPAEALGEQWPGLRSVCPPPAGPRHVLETVEMQEAETPCWALGFPAVPGGVPLDSVAGRDQEEGLVQYC